MYLYITDTRSFLMGKFFDQAGGWSTLGISCLGPKLNFVEQVGQAILDSNIPGLIAEAGVYKGGCARLLATIFAERDVLLFDSFEGMLEDDGDQTGTHKTGDFSDVRLDSVQHFLRDKPNCKFYKGWFPESSDFLTTEKFALVHADMDYYQSTLSCIEVFWPRIVIGGAMIFDDYEWIACPGVKKALQETLDLQSGYEIIKPDGLNTIAYIKTE